VDLVLNELKNENQGKWKKKKKKKKGAFREAA